ncbi:hypothetical protein RhiirA5_426040 [Rhizophagus irregularis]|uniref:Uncharacterized protein n=2 Tax=Rhizophagus irregularis TaxID=588596 RepID=A0A2N0P4Y4_9GLOM|nr:hypothetical protein GLOIN_2v1761142 [Rhizophagus irregularis DAOM 181602=DAOM 197198]PKC01877.1 hypothetical protein RhiirA5_426040 [Rhizophagus irregularis]PKK73092.1 hypothetical protein RhiirC2_709886 [Rhizophagus irregularis]POG83134.1 hypothetical protein GLOIN_2v1761142 [Rhizophagus irregularis DAOM 181602=DAOM 197198]UZO22389.1 hypothetical protein OCT59_014752 [Rhizophagus irregularis]CAB4391309.1 unnamed protein product [Rhizophagus irregularis]|eukprot:XP_025190000.1 hypothetical protein GLOIN_2v1761142 [Rhizophagus irregularis DAOM 181602=DAOM 197198]
MKFFALIISIIFSLAFLSLTEGYLIWIQNKLVRGTVSISTALKRRDGGVIDEQTASAHKGYHLNVPNNYPQYYLSFDVLGTQQQLKERGPINNTQDYCWHYHGNSLKWNVYPC